MFNVKKSPKCRNTANENQGLSFKPHLDKCPQLKDSKIKYNIRGKTGVLQEKYFKVEKLIKFLKETGYFKEI